jgi:hypothetical protein
MSTPSSVKVTYSGDKKSVDPHDIPVTIIGQVENLSKISFEDVKAKLDKRVNAKVRYYNMPYA